MAKFGERDQGYDPFNQISNSLSALSAPEEETASSPVAERESNGEAERRPRPVEVKPSRPAEGPRERSSGGVADSGGFRQKTVAPSVALRMTKRFKTTKEEGLRLDQAALRLGAKLGMSVDVSKISRALWEVYLRHEEEILRSAPEDMGVSRPANNDAVGLAEYDERLAELISEGLMMACMRQRRS